MRPLSPAMARALTSAYLHHPVTPFRAGEVGVREPTCDALVTRGLLRAVRTASSYALVPTASSYALTVFGTAKAEALILSKKD